MKSHNVLCSYCPAQNSLAIVLLILDVRVCELEMWTGRLCGASRQIVIYWFQYYVHILST